MSTNYVNITDPDIPGIYDAIDTPYNSEISCMFCDMRDSTGQKFEKSGLAWTSEFLKMYRIIEELLKQFDVPSTVKLEGDGCMIVVNSEDAHRLMNYGIAILEHVNSLSTDKNGQRGEIDIQMSVGVATGPAFRFRTEDGRIDHLSAACDRAARLCSAASAQAVFVDANTVEAANMTKIVSQFGKIVHRAPSDYRSPRERLQLKGIPDPVEYHEILYSSQLFGVRSSAVTEIANATTSHTPAAATPQPSQNPTSNVPEIGDQRVGRVKRWEPGSTYGFVTDVDSGEDFYLPERSLLYPDDVQHLGADNAEVTFVVAAALGKKASRRAVATAVIGQGADGKISFISSDKPFGFITVTDERGTELKFYVHVNDQFRTQFKIGDEVAFDIARGAKGARAVNTVPIHDDIVPAA
ncbi:adenylate/guanylate cyclase domain-containing protein [Rhodococcus sp. UFZ-B548]|uniref:adenylate/guanylate cyclase domain-containing protein n=1 Tax=Rhodococcus sp. UFZ-B548 TaxID=2742212 RepID=UPI0015F68289|nr:adenylate/guanylate cyclase domain-containing protein [Rhodococcus sp. UFZ-B548]